MFFRSALLWLVLGAALVLSGCYYDVYRHYPTRADAEARQLFLKGWLPAIIPLSSYSITTKNNLDINISKGDFYFQLHDLGSFLSHLTRLPPNHPQARGARRYDTYYYREDDTEWIFYVHPTNGHYRYRLQLLYPHRKSFLEP